MITTEHLDNKELIDEACALLYSVYIEQGKWKFSLDNPSKIRVEIKNEKKLLLDKFTYTSKWFGIFDEGGLIGCTRLHGTDESGKYEIEGYESSEIIRHYLPRTDCMEMGKVAVSMDYKGQRVINQLFLAVFEYCQTNKFSVFGGISNTYLKSLLKRVNLMPKLEQAFKYEEIDPAPVDFYFVNYRQNEFNEINEKLRESIHPQMNHKFYSVMEALEIVAPILPVPVYWHDKNGTVLGINDLCLQGMGATYDQVVGKNPYHFHSEDVAEHILNHNEQVMQDGQILSQEEIINNLTTGAVVYAKSVKAPLYDDNGNVIGIIGASLDMTAEKEAERLQSEANKLQHDNQLQIIALQEQEKFAQLARKVAHDINSPLASLKMLLPMCTELHETKRTLLNRATEGILDIANNLLSNYHKQNTDTSGIEPRQHLLVSDLLIQLLSEKKMQYRNHPVTFETVIASDAHFAFIRMQPTEFRRSVSNLINNAVDALEDSMNGKVNIQLTVDTNAVIVAIEDNGKGMTAAMIEKMQNRQTFTEGKVNGHGLGLAQVWDTLAHNDGLMEVQSVLGKGSSIRLTFPRIGASNWIAQDIHLIPDNIIVILDDDESIHTAWDLRFTPLLTSYPSLRIHHFIQGQEALNFLAGLSQQQKELVIFLSDYELLQQRKNGLEVVKESGIRNAMLVTSYYFNPKIREEAALLEIKILPKQMASIIPILFANGNITGNNELSIAPPSHSLGSEESISIPPTSPQEKMLASHKTDIVLLDDDQVFADAIVFRLSSCKKVVKHYPDPNVFLNEHERYAKDTPICIDNNFGTGIDMKGTEVAERLHALEFTRLFLVSGDRFAADSLPTYVTFIEKTKLDVLDTL